MPATVLEPTTYLTLVQRAAQECQLAQILSIDSTVDQTGQALDFCLWVNEAWKEIKGKYEDWGWNLISPGVSFTTVAAQTIYTATQAGVPELEVKAWQRESFRSYLTATGVAAELPMHWVPYDEWRDVYHMGALRTSQVYPMIFSIRPTDLALCVQCPLAGYTITGDYFQAAMSFDDDDDEPNIPREFVMAIVYRTMMFYGAAEGAQDVYNTGEANFNKLMGRLERTRMSEVEGPGALA